MRKSIIRILFISAAALIIPSVAGCGAFDFYLVASSLSGTDLEDATDCLEDFGDELDDAEGLDDLDDALDELEDCD
jgi:hypothetical protein